MTGPYPVPPPPGYGYGYGPPGGPAAPPWAGGGRAVNPAGIAVSLVGGALVLLAAFLPWYSAGDNDTVLADIVRALDVDGAKAFPKAYFGWLIWVVLAGCVVAALFANLPGRASGALRVAAPVLGAAGALCVVLALDDLIRQGSVFDNSGAGLYLTLIGFLVAGAGGALGPRRTR